MTRLLLLSLLIGTASAAGAQDWQVVWADEFDTDGAPDPAKWGYDLGGNGWGNQELQHYTNRLENARVADGVLTIEAREEAFNGNAYTSARLVTRGKASWTYGRIEARMKLPYGQGIWPAFWMLATDSPYGGWPFSGEIDIMEYVGPRDPTGVHGTIHFGGGTYAPCRSERGAVTGHCYNGTSYKITPQEVSQEFHTYAIEWEPRAIRWYVDDNLYQTQTYWYSGAGPYPAPFDSPFHILLNLAVGGQWPGYPDETTTFPQQLQVDYVRVYKDPNAEPTITLDGPTSGATVQAGATVALAATASDGGTVESVEFLQGDGVLGTDTEAPYALDVAGVADGCYSLRARATDDAGYVTTSEPVAVTVGAGCPAGSTAPFLMTPAVFPGVVEAEHYDLGGPDVAYRDLGEGNTGNGIRLDEGVDVQPSRDLGGGYEVTDIRAREWLSYTVDVAQTGRYRLQARIATLNDGAVRVSVDGEDLLGDVTLSSTGGGTLYGNAFLGNVNLEEGRHALRVDMRSAGFSLNHVRATFLGATASEEADAPSLDLRLTPNPVADRARIVFRLPSAGHVDAGVFDVLGRRVATLASGVMAPGEHTAELDASALAPGVYTCVLSTPVGTLSARLTVAR